MGSTPLPSELRLPYSFYDDLRLSPTANFTPLVPPDPSGFPGARNLHRAVDAESGVPDPGVVLCHVPAFLRWTIVDLETLVTADVSDDAYGESAAVLMAIHHFNTGDGSIVKELEGIHERCDIRFTTELVDTMQWSLATSVNLQPMLLDRSASDIAEPQMCALIGASTSYITETTASSTGIFGIPQVSASASSPVLDKSFEFLTFSRTHPSDAAMAERLCSYLLDELGVSYFAMLYVNNRYGAAFHEAVMLVASDRGMTVNAFALPPGANADDEATRSALTKLKQTEMNYIFGVFYPHQYEQIMSIAGELGVAGPGRYWIFSGLLSPLFVGRSTQLEADSLAAEATFGNSILHDEGGLPGVPHHDNFVEQFRIFGNDSEALSYVNSKQPQTGNDTLYGEITFNRTRDYFFRNPPTHFMSYSYDAVAGLGLSACNAQNALNAANGTSSETFSGWEHFYEFVGSSFLGASGNVSFGADGTNSRDANSTYFVVSNIRQTQEANGSLTFRSTPVVYYNFSTSQWTTYNNSSFVYPGNVSFPPSEVPPVDENQNHFHIATRAVCILLCAIAMSLSMGFLIFTIIKRKHGIIKASQPPFLSLICVGTLLLASAIIPFSMDDGVASVRGCEIACMSFFWLASIGFCLCFSALFSKLWRINQVFKNAYGFKKVQVTAKDVIVPLLVLLGSNIIVLLTWTIESPFTWEREALATNSFNQTTESVGMCRSEHSDIYVPILMAINGVAIVITMWQAWVARNIQTTLSESRYIAIIVVCIFEASFIGVPVLLIVQHQPTAALFITSGIIFIICLAVLLLLFVPKVLAMKKGETLAETRRPTTTMHEPHYEAAYRVDSRDTIELLQKENVALKKRIKALEECEP